MIVISTVVQGYLTFFHFSHGIESTPIQIKVETDMWVLIYIQLSISDIFNTDSGNKKTMKRKENSRRL